MLLAIRLESSLSAEEKDSMRCYRKHLLECQPSANMCKRLFFSTLKLVRVMFMRCLSMGLENNLFKPKLFDFLHWSKETPSATREIMEAGRDL